MNLISEEKAFAEAHSAMTTFLDDAIREARARAPGKRGGVKLPIDDDVEFPIDGAVTIPLDPVIQRVLGHLATEWFDIPDGSLIESGPPPPQDEGKLYCPFHFLAPSRYVFSSPNPRRAVEEVGGASGRGLLAKTRKFVEERREQERRTGSRGLKGPISLALFRAIHDDDDRLARVLVGLVFGFVPTVHGNALSIFAQWLGDETLWRVQQALSGTGGPSLFERAKRAVKEPMKRAMLSKPVPPLLHRTVTKATTLGRVFLEPDDRVVIGMPGVTQEILERGETNVAAVFGGDRRHDSNHPTHACPGYDLAMGVLLGILTSVLEIDTMWPGPAQISIRVPQ
jgi:hypothetical protein